MPSTDRKMVTVTTTCVAEVTETWRYSVPGDWTEETTEDYYDVLSRLAEDDSAEFIDVEDESTEERDREVTNVTVGELPAAGTRQLTIYYVGPNPQAALAGLPFDSYDSADDCIKDQGLDAGADWHVYSVLATVDESTIEPVSG